MIKNRGRWPGNGAGVFESRLGLFADAFAMSLIPDRGGGFSVEPASAVAGREEIQELRLCPMTKYQ